MAADPLTEARLAENQQIRQVNLLRSQLYSEADPTRSTETFQALEIAEQKLTRLEQARAALEEPDPKRGVLFKTSKEDGRPGGELLGAETTGVAIEVQLRQARVPTGIVHLLNPQENPLVSFLVKYAGDEYVRLRLTSFVEGYSAQAIDCVELFADQSTEVNQLPTFFPQHLRQIQELTPATLNIRIDNLDGGLEHHGTYHICLLARTSATLGIEDPATGRWTDLTPYLASWVTPNEPKIMALLHKAAEHHPRHAIAGYQTNASGVEAQVKAIYQAVKDLEIHYVHSVLSYGGQEGLFLQRIRLPAETIEHKSANCIDGTVLMASLLEAASLNPGIVLVPGHAFLAWETQNGLGEWDYLETTMVSTHDFEEAQRSGRAQAEKQKSWGAFLSESRRYRHLSIPDLRVRSGITPMV